MILLKKLELTDFLSHENTTINFKPDTKLLLDGPSGVGKSAIAEAITWCLYGIARTDNRALVRKGSKKASVTLELTTGDADTTRGGSYLVTRSVQATGKHSLDVRTVGPTGEEKAHPTTGLRELQKWIESDLLGASYLLFTNSVVYLQGGGDSFVGQTAARRKELLLELVKAENFDEYYEKAKEAIAELDVARAALEMERDMVNAQTGRDKDRIAGKAEAQKQLNALHGVIAKLEEQKSVIIAKQALVEGAVLQVESLQKTWHNLTVRHSNGLGELHLLKEKRDILAAEPSIPTQDDVLKAQDVEQERMSMLNAKPQIAANFVENAKNDLKRVMSEDNCPNDKCPHQKGRTERIDRLKKEIEEGIAEVDKSVQALLAWQDKYNALPPKADIAKMTRLIALAEQVATIPEMEARLDAEKKERDDTMMQIEALKKSFNAEEQTRLSDELKSTEASLRQNRLSESHFTTELAMIDQAEASLIVSDRKLSAVATTLNSLDSQQKRLELVKEAFGSKGIKTVVVDYLLPRLEDNVNSVLSRLSDFRIRFDTQRTSADGESQVEGLFITIINDVGEEMAFENYSGGERLKITVAISEALASLQKVGFRVFDEVFVGLDDNSTESFADVLNKMQGKFSQVICISHLGAIKDMFTDTIMVRKQGGISSVDLSTG